MILYIVRRAVSHLQLLFCVHQLFVASHVHATLLAQLHEMFVCECQVALYIATVYFVIVYNGFYNHLKLFAEQRRETST